MSPTQPEPVETRGLDQLDEVLESVALALLLPCSPAQRRGMEADGRYVVDAADVSLINPFPRLTLTSPIELGAPLLGS